MDKDDILAHVQAEIVRMFDLVPENVQPDSRLYEDLDIDSLDAVDLVGELRRQTRAALAPENFRQVRTVRDIADTLHALGVDHQSSA